MSAWILVLSLGLVPSDLDVTEHLGALVPHDLRLEDSVGQPVRLGELFDGQRPVLLVLSYYHCPMLCGLVLQGVARAVRELGWQPGVEYRVVTASFDPADGPYEARQKQTPVVEAAGLSPKSWPFLSARDGIAALTETLGFVAIRDDATGEYAHSAVVFVLSPEGRVSRYLYGIDYSAKDLKLALLEASAGKTGSALEKVLMRCYAYDPARRRYGVAIANLFRVGGLVILVAVGAMILRLVRRERAA